MEFIISRDYESELQHHGIKGQKWYKRRYQNKDGSLTPLGERRRSLRDRVHDYKVKMTRKNSLKKARATKEANKKSAEEEAKKAEERKKKLESGKIPASKMTNEELASSIARKQAEQRYKEAVLATSTGKRFVSKMWNDAVVPGMVEGGKKVVSKFVENKVSELLGISNKEVKSEYQRLKESAEMAKWRKQQFQDERDYTEARRRYEEHLERERRERENRESQERTVNEQRERDYEYEQNQRRANNENQRRAQERQHERDNTIHVDDPEIVGEGTSSTNYRNRHGSLGDNSRRNNEDNIVDVEIISEEIINDSSDTPVTNLSSTQQLSGRTYINNLLEDNN